MQFGSQSGRSPDDITSASHASRSFLLKVVAGFSVVIGAVVFTSWRGASNPTQSSTSGSVLLNASSVAPSTVDVADLAPATSLVPAPADGTPTTQSIRNAQESTLGLATPQAAARNLRDAWRDRDKFRALLYASVASVDKLFSWNWVPQVRQAGCTPIETEWLCRFEGPNHRWDSSIKGNAKDGYRVVKVRVGEPAGDLLTPDSLPVAVIATPSSTNPDGSPISTTTTTLTTTTVDTLNAGDPSTSVMSPVKKKGKTTKQPKAKRSSVATQQDQAPETTVKADVKPPQQTPKPTAKPTPEPDTGNQDTGPVPVQGTPPVLN